MSLAIKFGDDTDKSSLSGAIYFDVVTSYKKSLAGKVTSHPIEAGASISDHFISENQKFSISGVITSVDFSSIPGMLKITDPDDFDKINANVRPQAVMVSSGITSLAQFLPDVVTQFLGNTLPSVVVDPTPRINYKQQIESFMKDLLTGLYYNEGRGKWENRMTLATLFDIEGNTAVNPIDNLVVTSFSVNEDADTGDSLEFDMSLEKVMFVTLEKAEAPKALPSSKTAKATAPKETKSGADAGATANTTTIHAVDEANAGTAALNKAIQ